MPRRTAQAQEAAAKEQLTRLRLVIRNHQFREDVRALRKLADPFGLSQKFMSPEALAEAVKAGEQLGKCQSGGKLMVTFLAGGKPIHSYSDVLKKWDFIWIPSRLFTGSGHLPETAEDFEKLILEEMSEAENDQVPHLTHMTRPAVVASEPFDEWYKEAVENWDGTDQVVEVPNHIPAPGRVLNIQVDLSYPQDVIEAEIKKELVKAKDRQRELQDKQNLPARPKRLRLDTIAFQLKVYDLARNGKTFNEIRLATKRPVSTVKSAFLTMSMKISSLVRQSLSPSVTPKKSLPLTDIDPSNHVSQCLQCASAQRLEDMCDLAKHYMDQDYVSQHELPVGDVGEKAKNKADVDFTE